jgi:hypothetical protein
VGDKSGTETTRTEVTTINSRCARATRSFTLFTIFPAQNNMGARRCSDSYVIPGVSLFLRLLIKGWTDRLNNLKYGLIHAGLMDELFWVSATRAGVLLVGVGFSTFY